ncbi:12870_t:CDS:2, partial [Gigaspora rosea]
VIENLTAEKFSQSLVKRYGLTKNPDTQNFMIVLQYMDSNLCDFLVKTTELSWKTKFKFVRNISNSIRKIHNQNIIHKNLYSKNILVDEAKPHCVVSDFGLYVPKVIDEIPSDYADLMWDSNTENRPNAITIMKKNGEFA